MFSGSVVAIVTPLRVDGSVDFAAWDGLLDFHLQNGTNGVVVGGSTGESGSLSDAELRELTERACHVRTAAWRSSPSVATNCTATTVERMRRLEYGCRSPDIMVVTPSYVKPTQEGLYRHYAEIAERDAAPLIVYNVPSRTCCGPAAADDGTPGAACRRCRRVKEAVADVGRIRELLDGLRAGLHGAERGRPDCLRGGAGRRARGHLGHGERCAARGVGDDRGRVRGDADKGLHSASTAR